MTEADRAEAMARRLARTAVRLGVGAEGVALLVDAFRAAMVPRRARIQEDHHPDYLHPARTALILMDDARIADSDALVVALLLESRDPDLALSAAAAVQVDARAAAKVAAIPVPGEADETLVERLLLLPEDLARVAVAERLDLARHLHLRERSEWAEYHAVTCGAYAPMAERVDAALFARIGWWCEMFLGRFLQG